MLTYTISERSAGYTHFVYVSDSSWIFQWGRSNSTNLTFDFDIHMLVSSHIHAGKLTHMCVWICRIWLGCVAAVACFPITGAIWQSVSVEDFGAKGDNATDNTAGL